MFKKYYYKGKETSYSVSEEGIVRNDETGRIITGTDKSCEYIKVTLTIDGVFKTFQVHRLVAETFLPNPDNLPVVHHKDRNKHNNNVSNLAWVTFKENTEVGERKRDGERIEIIDDDVWKDIPNLPGYKASKEGKILNVGKKKTLAGGYRNGYLRVSIRGKTYSVHILIYKTFVGEIPAGMVLDHINGIRDDNRLENLRCVTQSENMHNAQKNGHKGQHPVAQYDLNDNFIKEYPSCTVAAKEFGVTYRAISSAADRNGTSCGYKWKKL